MSLASRLKGGIGQIRQAINPPKNNSNAAPIRAVPTNNNRIAPVRAVPTAQQQGGQLNLVNHSAEELTAQVDQTLERVSFGWSLSTKIMENFSEFWALVGPVILVVGTIGEVFLVLWLRQKQQDIIAGFSIIAVALVLEGTFLAVSYKAATIRNRAERRENGATDLDRKKLRRQLFFWCALASGVCATQIIFIVAQTKDTDIGTYGVWTFAILRAVFTLVADGYTAFAHEEKPTTAERALEELQQRAKMAEQFLLQKKQEVTIINDGILDVRAAHTSAIIKEEGQQVELEIARLQNTSHIKALQAQQEAAQMFAMREINRQRALYDPAMPTEERLRILDSLAREIAGFSPQEEAQKRIEHKLGTVESVLAQLTGKHENNEGLLQRLLQTQVTEEER